MLFGLLVLGTASVAITFKAYNLFAKEDYDFYEQSSDNEENNVVSTISSIDENANEKENLVNSNAAEAKKSETKGSSNTKKDTVGEITHAHLEEIAKIKMDDLNATSMEAAVNMIKGSCRSMGVKVVD